MCGRSAGVSKHVLGLLPKLVPLLLAEFPQEYDFPIHVASMSHGGFRMVWKPLEMLVSMSHNLVRHETLGLQGAKLLIFLGQTGATMGITTTLETAFISAVNCPHVALMSHAQGAIKWQSESVVGKSLTAKPAKLG